MEHILKPIRFKIFPIIFHIFFTILNYKNFSKCSCEKDAPIVKQGKCQLIYCTENEFENNLCSIDNDIIKTQWLNNFINFNEYHYIYTSMAINDEGDFILLSTPIENIAIRLFFVLKKNGRPFFKNNDNQEIFTKKIIVKDGDEFAGKLESQLFLIKLNNNSNFEENKHFLVSRTGHIVP